MIQVIPFTSEREPGYLPLLARGLSDLSALRFNGVEIQAQVNTELTLGHWDQKMSQPVVLSEWNEEKELWFSGNLCGESSLSLVLILYDPQLEQVVYRDQFLVAEEKFLAEWEKSFQDLLQYLKSGTESSSPRIYTKSLEAFLSFRKGLETLAQVKHSRAREEGLENLLKAVAYDPEFTEAIDVLLLFLIQNELVYDFEFSIDILERLRKISDKHPRTLLVLAEIYYQLGNNIETGRLLEELTTSFPRFVEGWLRLALFYNTANQTEEALAALQNVLAFEPENANVFDLMGAIYVAKGERSQAETMWLKALEIEPSRVNMLVNLALLAEEKEDLQSAENYYQQAIQTDNDWWGSFFYYGSFCQRQKRYEEAVDWLEKAVTKNDSNVQIYQNLATSQLELGRYNEAQESLLHLLKLAPNNTIRRQSLQFLSQLDNSRIKTEIRIRKLERLWKTGKRWLVVGELLRLSIKGKDHWYYWYLWGEIANFLKIKRLRFVFWFIGLKYQPGFPLLKKLGLYYWNKGDFPKSLSLLRQAYKLHRNDPEINRAYLQSLAKTGEFEELRDHIRGMADTTNMDNKLT